MYLFTPGLRIQMEMNRIRPFPDSILKNRIRVLPNRGTLDDQNCGEKKSIYLRLSFIRSKWKFRFYMDFGNLGTESEFFVYFKTRSGYYISRMDPPPCQCPPCLVRHRVYLFCTFKQIEIQDPWIFPAINDNF